MIKSIVSALDGSQESIAGLKRAVTLAEGLNAELRGIYVESQYRFTYFPTYSESEGKVPRPIPLPQEKLEEAENKARIEEEAVRAQFKKITGAHGIKANLRVVKGRINETLIREAQSADMIVIGNRGRDGGPLVEGPGPTTETVIHESLRPVLVVPAGDGYDGPVLLAFDSSRSVQRVLVPGLELIASMSKPLRVLTVKDDLAQAEEIQNTLRQYLSPHEVATEYITEMGEKKAAEKILAYVEHYKSSLLLMGAYNLSPVKEFFFGSITRKVLSRSPCPVLMMT